MNNRHRYFTLLYYCVLNVSCITGMDEKKITVPPATPNLITKYKEMDFILRLVDDYLNEEEGTVEQEAQILARINPHLKEIEDMLEEEEQKTIDTHDEKVESYVKRFPHEE